MIDDEPAFSVIYGDTVRRIDSFASDIGVFYIGGDVVSTGRHLLETCPVDYRRRESALTELLARPTTIDALFAAVFYVIEASRRLIQIQKSGQTGIPVTDIDGTIIVGFDEAKLKEFLKIK